MAYTDAIGDSDEEEAISPEKISNPSPQYNEKESLEIGLSFLNERNGGTGMNGYSIETLLTLTIANEGEFQPQPLYHGPVIPTTDLETLIMPTSSTSFSVRPQTTTMDMLKSNNKTYRSKTIFDNIGSKQADSDGAWETGVDEALDFLQLRPEIDLPENPMQHSEAQIIPQAISLTTPDFEIDNTNSKANPSQSAVTEPLPSSLFPELQQAREPKTTNRVGDQATKQASSVRRPSVDESQDELARPLSSAGNKSHESSKSTAKKPKRKRTNEEDHEVFAGLPQESYEPRKSRSRRNNEYVDEIFETIDFSVRPEAIIKGKKKKSKINRRQTTGGAIVVPVDNEDPFQDIDKESFEPAKSRPLKPEVETGMPEKKEKNKGKKSKKVKSDERIVDDTKAAQESEVTEPQVSLQLAQDQAEDQTHPNVPKEMVRVEVEIPLTTQKPKIPPPPSKEPIIMPNQDCNEIQPLSDKTNLMEKSEASNVTESSEKTSKANESNKGPTKSYPQQSS
jgi:hypothetical protein